MKTLDPNTISMNNNFLYCLHEMLPAQSNEDGDRRGVINSKFRNWSI